MEKQDTPILKKYGAIMIFEEELSNKNATEKPRTQKEKPSKMLGPDPYKNRYMTKGTGQSAF